MNLIKRIIILLIGALYLMVSCCIIAGIWFIILLLFPGAVKSLAWLGGTNALYLCATLMYGLILLLLYLCANILMKLNKKLKIIL